MQLACRSRSMRECFIRASLRMFLLYFLQPKARMQGMFFHDSAWRRSLLAKELEDWENGRRDHGQWKGGGLQRRPPAKLQY